MWFLLVFLLISIDDVTSSAGHGLVMPQRACRIRCENGGMCAFSFENPSIHSCICLMGVYAGDRCEIKIGEDPLEKANIETEIKEETQITSAIDVVEDLRRIEEKEIEIQRNAERRREYERKIKEEEERRRQMYEKANERPLDAERAREMQRRKEEKERREMEMKKRAEEIQRREEERRRLEEERRKEYARREEERIEKQRAEEERMRVETERRLAEEERVRQAEMERVRMAEEERVRQTEMTREQGNTVEETESAELTEKDLEPDLYDDAEWDYASVEEADDEGELEESTSKSELDHHRHVTQTGWDQESVSEDNEDRTTVASTENALGPLGAIFESAAEETVKQHGLNLEEEEFAAEEEYDDYWDHHPSTIDDFGEIPRIVDSEEEEEIRRDQANPQDPAEVREFSLSESENSDGWMMSSRADPQESSAHFYSFFFSFIFFVVFFLF